MRFPFRWRAKRACIVLAIILVPLLAILSLVRFNFAGDLEGLYLLRGTSRFMYEVKDEVLLGEYERVIAKLELEPLLSLLRNESTHGAATEPYLKYRWNKRNGNGYIQNVFPNKQKIIICLGRFLDSDQKPVHGLFVGGGLPFSDYNAKEVQFNETGMAFYTGFAWRHVWCNANEGLSGGSNPDKMIFPSSWDFLGSDVLYSDSKKLALRSRHRALVDGVPFRIDRYLTYKAGDYHMQLTIRFTNVGDKPTTYYYVYGDEPWLGDYGTSAGNVGWAADGLHYFEGEVDISSSNYFGMTDIGNKYVQGDAGPFTGLTNFISWHGMNPPNLAYFSNKEGKYAPADQRVPLYSRDNRVLFVQWGPCPLNPGESSSITMSIGFSLPSTAKVPANPNISVDWNELNALMSKP